MTDNKQDIKNTTMTSKLNKEEQKDPNLENEEETNSNPYYNNNAETIAKLLIEKMISITVTKVHSKETYERIGEHCFNYIKNNINEILKVNYIPYEIRHNQIEKIFFDRPKCETHNTWVEIQEPGTPIYDRCTFDQIKFNEFVPIEFDVIKSSNISNNELIAIDKDNEDKKNQNKENLNNENLNNKNIQNEIKENEKKIESRNQSKKITKNDKNEEKKEIEKIKIGKNVLIDLPSYDLDPSVYINEYMKNDNSEEINELRREKEFEIKKRDEQKRIEEELRRRELNQLQQQNKKQKDFDSKKLTFDSNGNIIKLKPKNNIESNLGNEFYWSRQTMRDVKTFRNQYGRQRNSFSNTKNKKLVDFAEGIEKTNKINENNENEEDDNIDLKNKKSLRRGSTLVEKKTIKKMREETEIIRNPNSGDLLNNKKNKAQQNKTNEMIIPGGQNFDIIIPEVGVNIITSDKRRRKEGGLNFSEKYKKPSMEEFSKLAFDTENLNTKRFLTGNFSNEKILSSDSNNQQQNNSMNININNKDNNYIGYSQQFQNDNPLIQNAHSILNKNDINNQSNISNNQLSFSYINQSNRTQLIKEIQLSKKMQNSNLKSLFYDNQDINNYKSYNHDYEIKSMKPTGANEFRRKIKSNIFNSLSKDYEITNQKGFDKFNSKIVKSRDWGSNNDSYGEIKNEFIKPHKGNKIRELGYRIVNTKLPRDRKFVLTSQNLPSRKVLFSGLNNTFEKNKEKENELI